MLSGVNSGSIIAKFKLHMHMHMNMKPIYAYLHMSMDSILTLMLKSY